MRLGKTGVGFRVPGYDPVRALVIDPVLSYSSLLGGASDEVAYGTAVDAAGRAYVVGYTASLDLPATLGAYQATARGGVHDAFVARLDPLGTGFEYVTYLGGGDDDLNRAV